MHREALVRRLVSGSIGLDFAELALAQAFALLGPSTTGLSSAKRMRLPVRQNQSRTLLQRTSPDVDTESISPCGVNTHSRP